ncbi:MAG: hypothetical protein EX260_10435 [Desulfobulbaceae bacterium]|nr:MAG: hypothetical protein EX260_10435 [Desulfobulbaceae bacterium]
MNRVTTLAVAGAALLSAEGLEADDQLVNTVLPGREPLIEQVEAVELEIADGTIIEINEKVSLPIGHYYKDEDGRTQIADMEFPNLRIKWSVDGEHLVNYETDYGLLKRVFVPSYEEIEKLEQQVAGGNEQAQRVLRRDLLMHEQIKEIALDKLSGRR